MPVCVGEEGQLQWRIGGNITDRFTQQNQLSLSYGGMYFNSRIILST